MKCPYPMPLRLRLKLAWLAFNGRSYEVVVGFRVGDEIDPNRLCDTRRWAAAAGKAPPCGNKAVGIMEPCVAISDNYSGGTWHLCSDCAEALREYTKVRQKRPSRDEGR